MINHQNDEKKSLSPPEAAMMIIHQNDDFFIIRWNTIIAAFGGDGVYIRWKSSFLMIYIIAASGSDELEHEVLTNLSS